MKRYLMLATALLLLSSWRVSPPVPPATGWYIPPGIQLLAWIGAATIVVLLVVFILAFGEPPHRWGAKRK